MGNISSCKDSSSPHYPHIISSDSKRLDKKSIITKNTPLIPVTSTPESSFSLENNVTSNISVKIQRGVNSECDKSMLSFDASQTIEMLPKEAP